MARGEEGRRILSHVAAMSAQFGTIVEVEEVGDEEGSVVGWVTAGGVVRVGEPADPTVGGVAGVEKGSGDGSTEVKGGE